VPPVPPPYPRPGSFQESLSTYLSPSSSGGPSTPNSAEYPDPQFIPVVITQSSSEYASQPPSRTSTASTSQFHYVDEAATKNLWSQFPSVVSVGSQQTYTPSSIELFAHGMPDAAFGDYSTEFFDQPQEITTQSASHYSYPPSGTDYYMNQGQWGSQSQFAVVQPVYSTEDHQYTNVGQPQISDNENGPLFYEGGSYMAQPDFEVPALPSYTAQAGPIDDDVARMHDFWTPEMLGFSSYPAPSVQWDRTQAF
jgi:hypothetical protein